MTDPKEDVWQMEWLIDLYQIEVINPLMSKAWVIEECKNGVTLDEIEECMWKDYKVWAEERILRAKEALAENYE